jgi:hypothetical protein
VLDYLAHSFPVQLYEPFTDSEGNLASRPAFDADGNPILNREACRARDAMLERLAALPPVPGALDQIVQHFGSDAVAEVTGRSRRIVPRANSDGSVRFAVENRPASANIAETHAFMDDKKHILVFSEAGGTGRSYHADLGVKNQRRRVHYLLEAGWKADTAIQGFGRTNRTNQKQPPLFRPVSTDVKAQKRFISTIARRLDSLGAITRGQRQTGGQNMFSASDNLESHYARDALRQLYQLLVRGKIDGCSRGQFETATGLSLLDNDGGLDATQIRLDFRDFYSGVCSVRVTPFQRFSSRLKGWNHQIVEKPRPGQFRYLRFAWKRLQGDGIMIQLHTTANSWNQRYHAGKLAATTITWGPMLPIAPTAPGEWTVVTRDLFKDFGAITLTGLALTPMYGGTAGLFDHFYLGRSIEDLDRASAMAFGREPLKTPLKEETLTRLWTDLGGGDVAKASIAVRTLLAGKKESVPFLARQIRTLRPAPEAKQIAGWITNLDDDSFEVREKATRELEKLGGRAAAQLRKALAETRSAEVRRRVGRLLEGLESEAGTLSPDGLRLRRAIRVLEWSATPEARKILEGLAASDGAGELAADLRQALERLKKTPPRGK